MVIDPKNRREEELNRQRKEQIEEAQDDDGIVGTVDRVFDSIVNPDVMTDAPDEEDVQRRRVLNDEESRKS